jgi:hypothetical protein
VQKKLVGWYQKDPKHHHVNVLKASTKLPPNPNPKTNCVIFQEFFQHKKNSNDASALQITLPSLNKNKWSVSMTTTVEEALKGVRHQQ